MEEEEAHFFKNIETLQYLKYCMQYACSLGLSLYLKESSLS